MLADTDAGNVVTAAQAGAQWGYRLLPLLLLLTPVLYVVQELTVRLGIATRRGYGELVREHFGKGAAWLAAGSLIVATIGSLITELTAIAGIGELYGLSRAMTLPLSVAVLMAVVATGSYRRAERVTLWIGACSLAFLAVAWLAHPDPTTMLRHAADIPLRSKSFLYLAAALIGAVFNPWMIFYQQAAVVEKGLSDEQYRAERRGTAIGAVLTQLLTGAVLIAMAATVSSGGMSRTLTSVGEISLTLADVLGNPHVAVLFSVGVIGAAMVAAVVASLALAWGLGEVTGYRRSLEMHPFAARWFYGIYAACVVGCAAVVWSVPNLVWLNIAAQALNALLLPLVIGFLLALAVKALPSRYRLRRSSLCMLVLACMAVCGAGLVGVIAGIV